MIRLYGRSLSWQRCVDRLPHGHWHSNTFIAALRHDRVDAPMLFDGPMNAAVFLQYVREVLAPTLQSGDLVICDTLSSHKCAGVREAIQAVGADIQYLPAYSPNLNPIEMAFAKIKAYLRAKPAETLEQILTNLAHALDSFSKMICSNLFRHAGYASI